MYELRTIPLFDEKFSKLIPKNKSKDLYKRILKLANNPLIGKPLGLRNLREIKLDKFRVYYIVFIEEVIVLLISVSDKKTQQKTIAFIKEHMTEFKEMIKNINTRSVILK